MKNRYKPEGTILKDYSGHWWILEKYHLHYACASYVTMIAYDRKANGFKVSINFDPESVDRMEEVTQAELVLYGKKD
jgi:hypothetical protein